MSSTVEECRRTYVEFVSLALSTASITLSTASMQQCLLRILCIMPWHGSESSKYNSLKINCCSSVCDSL